MSHSSLPHEFPAIVADFATEGRYQTAAPYGNGHINDTYVVNHELAEGSSKRYIAQKINENVFKNVLALMKNIDRVTKHLRKTGERSQRSLRIVPTKSGDSHLRDQQGGWWRLYDFIEGAHTVDRVTNETQARETALAFGNFQASLADLPGDRLEETIPHFHHTRNRFENFRQAVKENKAGRASDVAADIDFAFSREADADVLLNLLAEGKISERVTHNDTKINNVMLDDQTNRAVAVIDLDTVMPGLPLYDFGEMVRTSCSSTDEDDPNPDNMHFELPYFRALVDGYLASDVGTVLNTTECAHLGFAGKLMTYENGLRFLTDYLEGDTYYKIAHPKHNLDRTRTQFALMRSIEEKTDAMNAIVSEVQSST